MVKRAVIFVSFVLTFCSQAMAQQIVRGGQDREILGWDVASAGDVNGDGYEDVVVGAPSFDNGQVDEGRVIVMYGSATGIGNAPAWSFEVDYSNSDLGSAVASAGDVNGDGFDDLLVGAPRVGPRLEGTVYLFLGSAAGLSTAPAWTYMGVSGIEDFGRSVGSAGDINSDGYGDVIIGGPSFTNGETSEGRALVFLGSASGLGQTPAWSYESNKANALFGWSVASAGDTNGDGFSDVIVGALQEKNSTANQGRAYVFLGSAAGLGATPAWTFEGNQFSGQLGISVAGAGDVNRDGFADILVGEHAYSGARGGAGRGLLFLGSVSGPGAAPVWSATGSTNGGQLGYSVSSAGDVNKDGFADVLIGARGHRNNGIAGGAAFLYLGGQGGLASIPDWSYFGEEQSTFGNAVAAAGDINGDGYGDIIVGAPYDGASSSNRGAAYVFRGDATKVIVTDSSAQCSASQSTAPTSTPTTAPTATPTFTPTYTPTWTPTPTSTPTSGGSAGQVGGSLTPSQTPGASSTSTPTPTPTAGLSTTVEIPAISPTAPGVLNISCVAGKTPASLAAMTTTAEVSCTKGKRSRNRGRKSWAFKSVRSSGEAVTACTGSTEGVVSSFSVTGRALADRGDCGWRYSPVISASWQAGEAPKVTVNTNGSKRAGARKKKPAMTRRVAFNPVTRVLSGQMRLAERGASGKLSAWQPFQLVISGK